MTNIRQMHVSGIETIKVPGVVTTIDGEHGVATLSNPNPSDITVQYEALFHCATGNYPVLMSLSVVWAHIHGGPVVKGQQKLLRSEYGPEATATLIFMLGVRLAVMNAHPAA
jgi:hypothetical protein